MTARRVLGSLLATTLAATTLGVLGSAAPANAADTVETRIVAGSPNGGVYTLSKPARFGDYVSINVDVEALINGVWQDISAGPVTVTEQVVGLPAATVATGQYGSAYGSTKARGNATYTVSYGGGSGGYPQHNYLPSTGTFALSGVQRDIDVSTDSGRKAGFKGKLSPAAETKITVFKKTGKKYKKFKAIRSKSNGRFTLVLPAPKRGKFHWRVVFQGNSQFANSVMRGTTYKL